MLARSVGVGYPSLYPRMPKGFVCQVIVFARRQLGAKGRQLGIVKIHLWRKLCSDIGSFMTTDVDYLNGWAADSVTGLVAQNNFGLLLILHPPLLLGNLQHCMRVFIFLSMYKIVHKHKYRESKRRSRNRKIDNCFCIHIYTFFVPNRRPLNLYFCIVINQTSTQ